MLVDVGLKSYAVPSQPTLVTLRSRFLIKCFISLYLLTMLGDQVDTLHVGRCWSEVLCCTITTHLGDLDVKVTDIESFC